MAKVICLGPLYGNRRVNGYAFEEIPGTGQFISEELPDEAYHHFIKLNHLYVPAEPPAGSAREALEAIPDLPVTEKRQTAGKKKSAKAAKEN